MDQGPAVTTADEALDALLAGEGERVSILVPNRPPGSNAQEARIRLKNLLREAERRLGARGRSRDEIEATLAPGHALLDDAALWHDPAGLALYLSRDFARHFRVALPAEETVVVGARFYLLPLFRLAVDRDRFEVLALSPKSVRLFAVDGDRAEERELPGVPLRLTDVVGSDWEQNAVQMHSVRPGAGGAIVHGHGGSEGEVGKQEVARFCRRVDDAIGSLLGNSRRPLVLAAAEPLASLYRQVSRNPNLVRDMVAGNPELLSGDDLRQRAARLLEPLRARELEAEIERCRGLLGTGRASADLGEIVPAAAQGRVDTLLVAEGARRWGSWDAASGRVELHDEPRPESEELLNLAAVLTAQSRGDVRLTGAEALPETTPAAAIFRY
jgi:hypothetical protein